MAKKGMKRPERTHTRPRNEVPPVPELQGRAKTAKERPSPSPSPDRRPQKMHLPPAGAFFAPVPRPDRMDRTPAPDVRSTPKERGYHEKSYLLQGLGYKKDVKKKTKKYYKWMKSGRNFVRAG